MIEFIVIVESSADARTATKLAERVLVEKVDWLESDNLQYLFQWSGLQNGTEYSYWSDISKIIDDAKDLGYKPARFLGHGRDGLPYKADGATSIKLLNLVRRFLQKTRLIRAILLIRDLDNQPERRKGLEQARLAQIDGQSKLEIVIGTADRMREAWVLNGFIPSNQEEERILVEIERELKFDPCLESHRLREKSFAGANRIRNPKVVVEKLTGGNMEREQKCWEETSLELLRARGVNTGLTDYIDEVEQRLVPIIQSD